MVHGRFGVWVHGFRFRVHGLSFGLGFRVHGLGFGVSASGELAKSLGLVFRCMLTLVRGFQLLQPP